MTSMIWRKLLIKVALQLPVSKYDRVENLRGQLDHLKQLPPIVSNAATRWLLEYREAARAANAGYPMGH